MITLKAEINNSKSDLHKIGQKLINASSTHEVQKKKKKKEEDFDPLIGALSALAVTVNVLDLSAVNDTQKLSRTDHNQENAISSMQTELTRQPKIVPVETPVTKEESFWDRITDAIEGEVEKIVGDKVAAEILTVVIEQVALLAVGAAVIATGGVAMGALGATAAITEGVAGALATTSMACRGAEVAEAGIELAEVGSAGAEAGSASAEAGSAGAEIGEGAASGAEGEEGVEATANATETAESTSQVSTLRSVANKTYSMAKTAAKKLGPPMFVSGTAQLTASKISDNETLSVLNQADFKKQVGNQNQVSAQVGIDQQKLTTLGQYQNMLTNNVSQKIDAASSAVNQFLSCLDVEKSVVAKVSRAM